MASGVTGSRQCGCSSFHKVWAGRIDSNNDAFFSALIASFAVINIRNQLRYSWTRDFLLIIERVFLMSDQRRGNIIMHVLRVTTLRTQGYSVGTTTYYYNELFHTIIPHNIFTTVTVISVVIYYNNNCYLFT